MAGEIIRLGDPTSHHGTVIEGSQTDICMGKPIAYIGHKVHCPKCRGDFPIVEGVPTTTFYGKGVALAGMKTSCGAVLIATQFSDTVDWGGGGNAQAASNAGDTTSRSAHKNADTAEPANTQVASNVSPSLDTSSKTQFDIDFLITDVHTGQPVIDWPYIILLANGQQLEGRTSSTGRTNKIAAATAEDAVLHVYAPETTPINPAWDQ